ncbi:hypothetical protein B0O80DRAFT_474653 [Mortierella sp. GBAus27b]|nr:hypothetical protein B0O80DRAFT_474653 [Mortierella sp. GBAus27b]
MPQPCHAPPIPVCYLTRSSSTLDPTCITETSRDVSASADRGTPVSFRLSGPTSRSGPSIAPTTSTLTLCSNTPNGSAP